MPSRVFISFPDNAVCPVCNTSNNLPCILVEIDGTEHNGIVEGQPVHTMCLENGWIFSKSVGIIYKLTNGYKIKNKASRTG